LLIVFAGLARSQELPDAPQPKVADAKFVLTVSALGGSMAFDMAETRSALDRGAVESNVTDFGPHPSTRRLVTVESAYFAGFTLLAYEMKKPHSWIPRPIGRVLRATWWVPLGVQIGNHTRLGFQDRNVCRPSCTGGVS